MDCKKIKIKKEFQPKKKPFKCDLCKKHFSARNGLLVHIYGHFPSEYLTCRGCGNTQPSNEKYKKHMRECEELKKKTPNIQNRYAFKCDLCKKKFASKNGLRDHIYSHFPEEYFSCKGCKTTCRSYSTLKTHKLDCDKIEKIEKSHVEKPKFECDLCKKTLNCRGILKTHMYSHFPEYYFTCTGCRKYLITYDRYKRHVRDCKKYVKQKPVDASQENFVYQCVVCDKKFIRKDGLRKHMSSHFPEEYLTCKGCRTISRTPWLFSLHVLDCKELKKEKSINVNESTMICYWCKRYLATKSGLKRHINIHFPEELICKGCKETFKTVQLHSIHSRNCPVLEKERTILLKKRDYICDLCEKRFSKKSLTRCHMFAHFPEEYLTCGICSKMFKCYGPYKKHMLVCDKSRRKNISSSENHALHCDLCKKNLYTKHGLRSHMFLHFPEEYLTCKKCREAFTTIRGYGNHIRNCGNANLKKEVNTNRIELQCDLCKKTYWHKYGLRQHIFSHFPEEYLTCEFCTQMFKSYKPYGNHILFCDKSNKNDVCKTYKYFFECDLCKKNLFTKRGLRSHIYAHFPEEYLICKVCTQTCRTISGYKDHIRDCRNAETENVLETEKNERNYPTDEVKKVLNTEKNELQCDLCKKTFWHKDGIRRHIFSHFPEEYLTCEDCNETFKSMVSFNLHSVYCDVGERKNTSVNTACNKTQLKATQKNNHKESVTMNQSISGSAKHTKNFVSESNQNFECFFSNNSDQMEDRKEFLHGLISEIEIKEEIL